MRKPRVQDGGAQRLPTQRDRGVAVHAVVDVVQGADVEPMAAGFEAFRDGSGVFGEGGFSQAVVKGKALYLPYRFLGFNSLCRGIIIYYTI